MRGSGRGHCQPDRLKGLLAQGAFPAFPRLCYTRLRESALLPFRLETHGGAVLALRAMAVLALFGLLGLAVVGAPRVLPAGALESAADPPLMRSYLPVALRRHTPTLCDASLVEELNLGGIAYAGGIATDGEHVFLAQSRRLVAFDTADPANPQLIGRSDLLPSTITALAADSRHVYAGLGTDGLAVLDVGNATRPRVIYTLALPGYVHELAIASARLYLALGQGGLHILDLADPTRPRQVGELTTTGEVVQVAVTTVRAYLLRDDGQIEMVDAARPDQPEVIGVLDPVDWANDLEAAGRYVYLGTNTGVMIYDAADPTEPVLVGHVDDENVRSILVAGDRVFVDSRTGFHVIDVSDPAAPATLATLNLREFDMSHAVGLVTIDGYLYEYCVTGFEGDAENSGFTCLLAMEVSEPKTIRHVGSYTPPVWSGKSVVSGSVMYIASEAFVHKVGGGPVPGLWILDVANPARPRQVGFTELPFYPLDLVVQDRTLFVADARGYMHVLDIANPTRPYVLFALDWEAESLMGAGSTLYGLYWDRDDGKTQLVVIDASTPTEPRYIGALDLRGTNRVVALVGAGTLLVGGNLGLQVVDVRDPENPRFVTSVDTPHTVWGIAVAGQIAYVTLGVSSVQVYDLTDPHVPFLRMAVDLDSAAYSITVAGDHAYLGGLPDLPYSPIESPLEWPVLKGVDLTVMNISNSTAPCLADRWMSPGEYELSGLDMAGAGAGQPTIVGDSLFVPFYEPVYGFNAGFHVLRLSTHP